MTDPTRGRSDVAGRLLGTLRIEVEEVEGPGLDIGWGGIENEGCVWVLGRRHGVAGKGCELGEQRAEAEDGKTVGGALGRRLAAGGLGSLGWGDDGGAGGFGGGPVVVVVEDGREGLAHVPFEVIG